MTVIAANPGRPLYPAYVYSGQHEDDNENPQANFLDIDAHPENNPDGHDAEAWRDAVVALFLEAVPGLRPGVLPVTGSEDIWYSPWTLPRGKSGKSGGQAH